MTQLSLPLADDGESFCMANPYWAARYLLCADCLKLGKDCRCRKFRCCIRPGESYRLPSEILREQGKISRGQAREDLTP